ncbi:MULTISPECIES: hypothetical protein [Pseudomonas]|uniref:hypothetical protein n=1 Tax=Pseudomonas TaxID=286 RepID=UPI0013896A17|nr:MULTISPECIES: hypothetical protein [Pseudomonas]QSL89545.1 hypothetical protein JWU58_09720 [Pseudomonas atacamensis]
MGCTKTNITFLKGNYLTSTLLKNYFMLILCSPVKTRLSARLTARLTKITFFRCLSRKRNIAYQVVQPIASPLTQADDEETLVRSRFARDKNVCGKCFGLERQACTDDARGMSLVPPGKKKKWGGTKMVRAILDDAGGYGFSGLQD